MIRNLREVFLSKIPPSLNDFRAFVQEDEQILVDSATPNLTGANTISSKDIEMRGKLVEDSGISFPEMLLNLDYDGVEEKSKEGEEVRVSFDNFSPAEEERRESVHISTLSGGN